MKEIGIYVHIPFCKKKCFYCDFCSFECDENTHKDYVKALINEIRAFRVDYGDDFIVKTLYFGGGTPSYIEAEYIQQIVNCLKEKFLFHDDIEATIEVNPGTTCYEKIKRYREIGFNRLSIGLQSTNDNLLKIIGRIHNYEDFEETYNNARNAGFMNINVDLMIGLPTQTIGDVKDSLEKIIKKNPEHISIYSLILEDETKLKKMVDEGKVLLPDEDVERNMYWLVKNALEEHGYEHYEISNFSKSGYESKHNTDCWKQKEYLAFGLAAHSYMNDVRYSNITNLNEYINRNLNGTYNGRIIEEHQDIKAKMNEFVILGLRMIKGFSEQSFKEKFHTDFYNEYKDKLEKLIKMGLLQRNDNVVSLTNKGIDLANIVWCEFI
ncbi:MAG: oxygen-independent coproporphyrinogen III oxidase [Clostridia bacterium]|nr:oxygen-independent coproporphyrinogen III oxidase [Clostridia bacterium]